MMFDLWRGGEGRINKISTPLLKSGRLFVILFIYLTLLWQVVYNCTVHVVLMTVSSYTPDWVHMVGREALPQLVEPLVLLGSLTPLPLRADLRLLQNKNMTTLFNI
jgi:hypothetical protein